MQKLSLNFSFKLKKSVHRTIDLKRNFLHKGGGQVNRKKFLDFYYIFLNTIAIIRRIENDSSRNVSIALISYQNEVLSYVLATDLIIKSEFILFLEKPIILKINVAQITSLKNVSISTPICTVSNMECFKNKKSGQFIRAAGCFGKVLKHFLNYSLIKLPSSEIKFFLNDCKINMGIPEKKINFIYGQSSRKAGKSRNLGYKMSSRKCAQNPVDHPHGGNTSSKAIGLNMYGKLQKFKKTKNILRVSKKFIFKSRK